MSVARPKRPPTRSTLVPGKVTDAATDRALDAVAAAVNRLEGQTSRSAVVVDLAVGTNKVTHGLGRTPRGANVTPTVADATYAWALTSANERQVVITVIGAAQPGACVEVY